MFFEELLNANWSTVKVTNITGPCSRNSVGNYIYGSKNERTMHVWACGVNQKWCLLLDWQGLVGQQAGKFVTVNYTMVGKCCKDASSASLIVTSLVCAWPLVLHISRSAKWKERSGKEHYYISNFGYQSLHWQWWWVNIFSQFAYKCTTRINLSTSLHNRDWALENRGSG